MAPTLSAPGLVLLRCVPASCVLSSPGARAARRLNDICALRHSGAALPVLIVKARKTLRACDLLYESLVVRLQSVGKMREQR